MIPHLDDATWKKSSRSDVSGGVHCVEVARADGGVGVRDSKKPSSGSLLVHASDWLALTSAIKQGRYDL